MGSSNNLPPLRGIGMQCVTPGTDPELHVPKISTHTRSRLSNASGAKLVNVSPTKRAAFKSAELKGSAREGDLSKSDKSVGDRALEDAASAGYIFC